ncbi:MAG TPA: choice-of-anchor tandem repeat GloVer-containing protein [Candidatus Binatia bacterium]|nr:choice-of-anchor tandem repeat GloVer-containing protein [Candidatus Binatia bacterium]
MKGRRAAGLTGVFVFALYVLPASPQTFTRLYGFCEQANCDDGFHPYAGLVQGIDGSLYGTTSQGGDNGQGAIFKITPGGHFTSLYSFCSQTNCADGSFPYAGLILGADGNFYGTTELGGINGAGTVFRITPERALTTLYSFCSQANCSDGSYPYAALLQASDGNFFGTTTQGGNSASCTGGCGTVFRITPGGALTTLYSFCAQSNCADGSDPYAAMVQGSDGDLYGTTYGGGASPNCDIGNCGTAFKLTPEGLLTTIYTFCTLGGCSDGSHPADALLQGNDGNLYGTTAFSNTTWDCFELDCGTVFKLTTGGQLTTLYSFCHIGECSDGSNPYAALIQATDGNLYGTAAIGGTGYSGGTVFKITTDGILTTIHSFCTAQYYCSDGYWPQAGLVQATNGAFYGTTTDGGYIPTCDGGWENCGEVYSLSVGLRPFVELRPTSGAAGSRVFILGNNLTGSTEVTFNGTAAAFSVASDTLIQATVPAGTTTGFVRVTNPKEKLRSSAEFDVVQ